MYFLFVNEDTKKITFFSKLLLFNKKHKLSLFLERLCLFFLG